MKGERDWANLVAMVLVVGSVLGLLGLVVVAGLGLLSVEAYAAVSVCVLMFLAGLWIAGD